MAVFQELLALPVSVESLKQGDHTSLPPLPPPLSFALRKQSRYQW